MFKELLTVIPHLLGLIWGLFRDPRVPASRKVALGALIAYLSTPVDLVPDFIPLLGYLDDIVLVAVVFDAVINHIDREIVLSHWKGDAATLDKVGRLSRRVAFFIPQSWKRRLLGSPGSSASPADDSCGSADEAARAEREPDAS